MPRTPATVLVLACGLAASGGAAPGAAAEERVYDFVAVTRGNELVHFRSDSPGRITHRVALTGLRDDYDEIWTLAARPGHRELYALGLAWRLYRIDPWTGRVTWKGDFMPSLDVRTPHCAGLLSAMDFDPADGMLRVFAQATTFRIDPDRGTLIDADPATQGVQPDRDGVPFVEGDVRASDVHPACSGFAFDRTQSPAVAYGIHGWWLVRFDGVGTPRGAERTVSTVGEMVMPGGGQGDCHDLLEITPDGAAWRIAQRVNAGGAYLCRVDLATGAASPLPRWPQQPETGTEIGVPDNVRAFCIHPDWMPSEDEPAPGPRPDDAARPDDPAVPPPTGREEPPPGPPAEIDTVVVDVDPRRPGTDSVTLVGSVPFDGATVTDVPVEVRVGDGGGAFVPGHRGTARDGGSTLRLVPPRDGTVRFRVRLTPADLAAAAGDAARADGAPLAVVVTVGGVRHPAEVRLKRTGRGRRQSFRHRGR